MGPFTQTSPRPQHPRVASRWLLFAALGGLFAGAPGCGAGSAGNAAFTQGPGTGSGKTGGTPNPTPRTDGLSVSLAWEAPALNADGSPLNDLIGYRLYRGTSPGHYTSVSELQKVTEFTTEALAPGTYYFAMTAYDSEGNESDFSGEVVAELTPQVVWAR